MKPWYFYKIFCKDSNIQDIYIGKTCDIIGRMRLHKHSCKSKKDIKLYNFINDNGGWDNFDYIILKEDNFVCEEDATIIEDELCNKYNPSLNTYRPIQDVAITKIKRDYGVKKFRFKQKMEKNLKLEFENIKCDFKEMKNEIIMEMEYFNKEINNIIQRITNLNIVKKDNDLVINICDENNFKEKINTTDTTKSKYQKQIDKRKTDPKWKEYQKNYRQKNREKINQYMEKYRQNKLL